MNKEINYDSVKWYNVSMDTNISLPHKTPVQKPTALELHYLTT